MLMIQNLSQSNKYVINVIYRGWFRDPLTNAMGIPDVGISDTYAKNNLDWSLGPYKYLTVERYYTVR